MENTVYSGLRGRHLVGALILVAVAAFAVASTSGEDVAAIDETDELQALLDDQSSSTLELTKDYVIGSTVGIARSLTVHGNGHSITSTTGGSAIWIESCDEVVLEDLVVNATASAGRGVYVCGDVGQTILRGCTVNAYYRGIDYDLDYGQGGGSLTIDGTAILNSQVSDYDNDTTIGDTRGIAVYGAKGCTIQVLNGSAVKGFGYSFNLYNDKVGDVRPGGNTYIIRDSTIVGWSAINVWTVKNTFEITNSILRGMNYSDGGADSFALISLVNAIYAGDAQNRNVFNIYGGVLEAHATGTAAEYIILESAEALTKFGLHEYNGEPVIMNYDGTDPIVLRYGVKGDVDVTGMENVRSSSRSVDEDTGQTITTSTETVKGGSGACTRTSISTSTADDIIRTEAVVSDGTATVAVTAASGASLADAVSQASLVGGIVTGSSGLPDEISRTEITVEKEGGPSVTLALEVAESLVADAEEGSSVQIVVGDRSEVSMTSAQASVLGNGTAYEISALLVGDSDGKVIRTIHDLGASVTAFLPYTEGSGDPEGLGVYHIDARGEKADMGAEYDPDRNGYVFSTDHFSLFAVMEIPTEPRLVILPMSSDDESVVVTQPSAVGDGDSGDGTKTAACAAAAVVAALMVVFLAVDLRRSR